MSFPAQYLTTLGNVLYLTPDTDGIGYLIVNSQEGYDAYCDSLKAKFSGAKLRLVMRHCCATTATVEPDKLGRITIPEELCKHAHLEGKVAIIGVSDYAEIWDEEHFTTFDAEGLETINALMAEE